MKKVFCVILAIFFTAAVNADNLHNLKHKNIKLKDKIYYDLQNDYWYSKADSAKLYKFTKTKGFGDFYDYVDENKNFAFTTDCEYEFIYNGNFIGYSNKNLKFYNMSYLNGRISKRELSKEEIQKLFPEYNIIGLSEFSNKTNSYKIKKHLHDLNIILINDINKTFDKYSFSSGNARFTQYPLKSFLTVTKPGMIQFSGEGIRSNDNPWYVLLVR